MAMEIWNINLYYEDENKEHKVLEASMDRTNISFYDLVNLIEGVGFSGIDYLYYRKKYQRGKGHLVHIDNDTHVRKMITEHRRGYICMCIRRGPTLMLLHQNLRVRMMGPLQASRRRMLFLKDQHKLGGKIHKVITTLSSTTTLFL
jgi:hypothetical protein